MHGLHGAPIFATTLRRREWHPCRRSATDSLNAAAHRPPTPPTLFARVARSPCRSCSTAGLAAFALYPPVRAEPPAALVVPRQRRRPARVELVAARSPRGRHTACFTLEIVLRPQHYVQACAHTAIFLYWGWYWPPVYEFAYLIVAQLLFAYAFDMLLSWSRRDTYTLGFGPFPIIFSTNLFLWFKAGLVLPAVPDDRRRLRRQGIHPLEQGRTPDPHLQSVVVHADDILAGAAC